MPEFNFTYDKVVELVDGVVKMAHHNCKFPAKEIVDTFVKQQEKEKDSGILMLKDEVRRLYSIEEFYAEVVDLCNKHGLDEYSYNRAGDPGSKMIKFLKEVLDNKVIVLRSTDNPVLERNATEESSKPLTPESLAKDIVDHPNLWGMYSIADAIHKMLMAQNDDLPEEVARLANKMVECEQQRDEFALRFAKQYRSWTNEHDLKRFKEEFVSQSIPAGEGTSISVGRSEPIGNVFGYDSKDWEIVAYYDSVRKICTLQIDAPYRKEDYSIHSVKRLSDGEVFSVGDEIWFDDHIAHRGSGKIITIENLGGGIVLTINKDGHSTNIAYANKKPQPQQESKGPIKLSNYETVATFGDYTVYLYEGKYYLRYKEFTLREIKPEP